MILVDTGVWSRHFRAADPGLVDLLRNDEVLTHPWIVGELALGPGLRLGVLADIQALPSVAVVADSALLDLIRDRDLRGIGYVDAQLLAAAMAAGARMWTTDGALRRAATELNLAAAGLP